MACGMSVIMLISPVFPLRSGFPGTVQLIIAVGIIWRIYHSCELNFISLKVKKILLRLSYLYFIITTIVAFSSLYKLHVETEELISFVNQAKRNNHSAVLEIKPFTKSNRLEDLLSGFHLIENELTEEENSWENVAFSRYYGIKGIRVAQEKNVSSNQQ